MSSKHKEKNAPIPDAVSDSDWGEKRTDNFGYTDDQERLNRRGLEDWEMLQDMETSKVSIPYWFFAIFVVLLLVAIGLTFPFWGNRPGYERPWFDWGIPAGVAWVVVMSFVIYYFVDLRHILKDKKNRKELEQKNQNTKGQS